MQKAYRIRKNSQFQYVYRKGKGCAAREVSLVYVRSGKMQAGFSVSKKVGNAVTRNKIKRRMRAFFRLEMSGLKRGFYVFTARPAAAECDYQTLSRSMRYLLRKQSLYKDVQ